MEFVRASEIRRCGHRNTPPVSFVNARFAATTLLRCRDVASRMESLAEPGGINVSRAVRDQVRDRLPIAFEDLGEHEVRNVARPVRVFRIAGPGRSRRRFPYALFFRIVDGTVHVVACFHSSRDPRQWQRR
jgi:plasmid stabilization system protein ParE